MRFWLRQLLAAIRRLTRTAAQAAVGEVPFETLAVAGAELDEVSADINTLADLAGRRQVRAARRRMQRGRRPVSRPRPSLPNIPLKSAVADLIAREPGEADTAAGVAAIYRDPDNPGFALTKAPNVTITQRVKELVEQALVDGVPEELIVDLITDESENFDQSYARMVLRTNVNTAINRGKLQQAQDMAQAFPALEYETAGDSDVRDGSGATPAGARRPENHEPMEGFTAATDWPGWVDVMPPNGYSCRCGIRLVSRAELHARGLIDSHGNLDRSLTNPTIPADFEKHPNF